MALEGSLVRCPNCIAPIPGAVSADPAAPHGASGTVITLEPEGNRCPKCGHVFSAARALIEDYGKRSQRAMGKAAKAQG